MNLNEYQERAMDSAFYPDRGRNLVYPVLGLCGEAGELANKVKKTQRDGLLTVSKIELEKELGDVLWYVAAIADELHLTLSEVASMNLSKLLGRTNSGTLKGSGDER